MERLVDSMRKKVLLGVTLALVAFMAIPGAAAFAHDEVDISCSLSSLAVTVEGSVELDGNELTVSGQVLEGFMTCNLSELDSVIVIVQDAAVEIINEFGDFSGEVEGEFTLFSFIIVETEVILTGVIGTGDLEGDIEGGNVVLGDPDTLAESIDGEWELEADDIEAEGTFDIGLAFDTGFGTLVGAGALSGDAKFDD